jgi:hypothetical protein
MYSTLEFVSKAQQLLKVFFLGTGKREPQRVPERAVILIFPHH